MQRVTSRTLSSWAFALAFFAVVEVATPVPARACSPGNDSLSFGIERWIGRDDVPRDWVLTLTRTDLARGNDRSIWIRRLPDRAFEALEHWSDDDAHYAAPANRPVAPGTYEVSLSYSPAEATTEAEIADGVVGTFDVVDEEAATLEYPALLGVSSYPVTHVDPLFLLHGCGPPYDGQTLLEFRYRRDPNAALYVLRTDEGLLLQAQRPTAGDEVVFQILDRDGGEFNVELFVFDFAGRLVRTDAFAHAGCPGACSQSGNRASFVALFALLLTLRVRRHRAKEKACAA